MTLTKKIIAVFSSTVLAGSLFGNLSPANALDYDPSSVNTTSGDDQALVDELLEYAVLDQDGNIVSFDVSAAQQENASATVIESAQEFNSSPEAYAVTTFADSTSLETNAQRVGFPVHGRWCGPGHSGPGAPVDLLDSRCRTHDLCYAANGYFNKSCDRTLVAQLTVDINKGRYSGWVLAKAIAIRAFFTPNAVLRY